MKFIVVTGGIASGKSTVVRMLADFGGKALTVFDCDAAVAQLYQSGRMSRDLVAAFGADALDEKGAVNKDFLRDIVKNDPEGRHKLEELTHPKLAVMCQEAREKAAKSGKVHTFVLDIPLFFEGSSNYGEDLVCVVATSHELQMQRLMQRDDCTLEAAEALAAVQAPTQQKIDKADVVFWNEGSEDQLRQQVEIFCKAQIPQEEEETVVETEKELIDLNKLRALPFHELQRLVETLPKRGLNTLARADMLLELGRYYLSHGHDVVVTGALELCKDNFAMLRDAARSFAQSSDDIYVSLSMMQKHGLRAGNMVKVRLRPSRGNQDKYLAAAEVLEVEGTPLADYVAPTHFDKLTPLFPRERLILETPKYKFSAMRVLDLITPLGMGQRGLLVAPPRGGKTVLLKMMAKCLRANYPDAELLILLLDERPEEVTDFEETIDVPVFASTFDEPSKRHALLSDMILERARRRVEQGKDVIILLDSLTRLARGYNANVSGGRTMSGGLGSSALEKPRKFFGAARNVEEGGSLTILATCLVETESRMDEIIFEEFKGTGNMEIHLDRELAERRIYPAISIPKSGTRNDDRLYHPDEMARILQLRRQLASMPGWEGLETLLKNITKTQNNAELLLKGLIR